MTKKERAQSFWVADRFLEVEGRGGGAERGRGGGCAGGGGGGGLGEGS